MASHTKEDIDILCDRVYCMDKGFLTEENRMKSEQDEVSTNKNR